MDMGEYVDILAEGVPFALPEIINYNIGEVYLSHLSLRGTAIYKIMTKNINKMRESLMLFKSANIIKDLESNQSSIFALSFTIVFPTLFYSYLSALSTAPSQSSMMLRYKMSPHLCLFSMLSNLYETKLPRCLLISRLY